MAWVRHLNLSFCVWISNDPSTISWKDYPFPTEMPLSSVLLFFYFFFFLKNIIECQTFLLNSMLSQDTLTVSLVRSPSRDCLFSDAKLSHSLVHTAPIQHLMAGRPLSSSGLFGRNMRKSTTAALRHADEGENLNLRKILFFFLPVVCEN